MTATETADDFIPNLVMQFRKAIDVNGNCTILFKDGNRERISLHVMNAFLEKYSLLRPADREEMQATAIKSKLVLLETIDTFNRPPAPKSIYIK